MTKTTLTALTAVLAAGAVFAEDAEEKDDATAEAPAAEEASAPKKVDSKIFTILPFCQQADGTAEVLLPGAQEWTSVAEGRFYPLGASYRTIGDESKIVIAFGAEAKASLEGDASFGTRAQALDIASRTIVALSGTLKLDLARTMPEGAFIVTTPGFMIKNPAGESKIVFTPKADGNEAVVRCVTGTLAIDGRHFTIPQMRAADEIRVRGTLDNLETLLYGTSGDYIVKIDRGIVPHNEVDDEGKVSVVSAKAELDWHLSPKTKVRINRLLPALGERMSVAVMTFDAAGTLKNNFAFSEGRAEVNSGELVAPAAGDAAEKAKKAAAAAEETTTEAASDDDEEDSDKKNKKEEE